MEGDLKKIIQRITTISDQGFHVEDATIVEGVPFIQLQFTRIPTIFYYFNQRIEPTLFRCLKKNDRVSSL
jgi:hypothetical protein